MAESREVFKAWPYEASKYRYGTLIQLLDSKATPEQAAQALRQIADWIEAKREAGDV